MAIRNKRPDLNGILVIDKPLGWTSARACHHVRRVTGGAKVGHAGTLDPLATGVLVLCLGRATKRISQIMGTEKRYEAMIDLSKTSPSDDLETEPEPVPVDRPPARGEVERALAPFHGTIRQRPPAYSAIQVRGERAYHAARAGRAMELEEREVVVHEIKLLSYEWPLLKLEIRCGKGTYIRSLARDIGEALGTGGVLTGLVRTAVGPFSLQAARSPEDITPELAPGDLIGIDEPPAG